MSTAGSVRSDREPGPALGPGPSDPRGTRPLPDGSRPSAESRQKPPLFRRQGLVPLTLMLTLLGAGWALFGERVIKNTGEEVATKLLGTQVEAASLEIRESAGGLVIGGLHIADPFDPMRNLIEAEEIRIELDPVPLLEKKLVVRRLSVDGVRLGTGRRTPARVAPSHGFASRTAGEIRRWAAQLRRPLATLTPIDTVRTLALDPAQLSTVREAQAVGRRADSLRGALEVRLATLRVDEAADSARALAQRLSGANVRTLGIDGTGRAAAELRRTIAQLDSTKRRIESLSHDAQGGYVLLRTGVSRLEDARRRDYAFARRLLRLPSVERPAISTALLGDVTIERFQRAVYWAELARKYMPPGLRPQEQEGPQRLRRAGTTTRFPRERHYPSFLLEFGALDVEVGGVGPAAGRYAVAIANLTSEPALVRKPVLFTARRTGGGGTASLQVKAILDHLGTRPRVSLGLIAAGVSLPGFDLPGLPYRAELGQGTSRLDLVRLGDRVAARWMIRTGDLRWRPDSGRLASLTPAEALVSRVVTALDSLELTADLTGELRAPALSVRSNLDRALADRLEAIATEQLAKAEAKARAAVDQIVVEETALVKAKVAAVEAESIRNVGQARERLSEATRTLQVRLKELTRMPGG
jgi:uncharacterized protein (TIGR03545 family)